MAPRVRPALGAVAILLALAWAACFRQPDVTKMSCIPSKGCPTGYVCVVSGSTGHCERPGDGATVADVEGTAKPDSLSVGDGGSAEATVAVDGGRTVDASGEAGRDTAVADVSIGGPETGNDAADLAAGGSGGSGGTTATGGTRGNGGVTGSGGIVATGGSPGGGGAGTTGTGGLSFAGGGTVGTGGLLGSGGFVGTGGRPGTGGAGTGGAGTGGTGTGGTPGTGGVVGTGGSGTGGATFPPSWSAGCGKAPTIPSSQYNNGQPIAISASDMQRRYVLSVPTNYDNGHAYRLVIALHPRDGNDRQMYSWGYYGLLGLANDSTIFVAPNGQIQSNSVPCTGTGIGESGCGWPNTSNRDLLLIDAVVAQVEASFCVDTNLIFAAGWSYGAGMAYETACQRPLGGVSNGYIRAIAVYSGAQLSGNCVPSKPVAYYASHGTEDNVLPYNERGLPLAQKYATANGCAWATPTEATGSHICTSLTGCAANYPLEFCSFVGGHTAFPDSGQMPNSWGPQETWTFLSRF